MGGQKPVTFQRVKRQQEKAAALRWWAKRAEAIEEICDDELHITRSELWELLRSNGWKPPEAEHFRKIMAGRFCPPRAGALILALATIFASRDLQSNLSQEQKWRKYHDRIAGETKRGVRTQVGSFSADSPSGESPDNFELFEQNKSPTVATRVGEEGIHPLVYNALLHDDNAEAFRISKGLEYNDAPSFGRTFELRNWIFPRRSVPENGLSESEITIEKPSTRFSNFDASIVDVPTVSKLTAEKSNNGKKVSLVGLFPALDVSDENLRVVRLTTAESDYYTNMGALATIQNDRAIRHRNMSIKPEAHRIPNAISIHYVIRFSDGKLLASHRSKDMAYDPEHVSFSGNEQLKPEDFESDRPLEMWLLRSMLEEVFPLRKFSIDSPEALEAASLIALSRFLSLYLEEKVGNFGLVCFVQFNVSSAVFAAKYYGRRLNSSFGEDKEGKPYLMTEAELARFFESGKCELMGLTDADNTLTIAIDGLNSEKVGEAYWRLDSTSLYRMWLVGQLLGIV
jgi:hypothetical protein